MRKPTDLINRDMDQKVVGHTENATLAFCDKLSYDVSQSR